MKSAIDLGSGTGVLGFILKKMAKTENIFAIDSNPEAVKCSKLNASLLEIENYSVNE